MLVCTSICANYLPKAMALAKSVKKTNPYSKFLVSLVEKEIHPAARECPYFDFIVLAKDLGFLNFEHFMFKHSIVEASTSVKGQLFKYMVQEFPNEDKFIYLDPDILVFSELKELIQTLDEHSIVLTPHLLNPGNIQMEISSLQHGTFNLGFLAIKRSQEAEAFINWWTERLEQFCYDDIPNGIFTDQKWIDLAPSFFDTFILKHHGYNVATWSLMTTKITKQNGEFLSDGVPLRFFHFSGYDGGTFTYIINLWVPDKTNPIYELAEVYKKELQAFGQQSIGKTTWSYDYFDSGEKIERDTRIAYRENTEFNMNPFSLSNKEIVAQNAYKTTESKIIIQKVLKAILHPMKAARFLKNILKSC